MNISVKSLDLPRTKTDCIVVAVYKDNKLTESAKVLDTASQGYLSSVLKQGDMSGKPNQTLLLHKVPGLSARRVLLLGCGKAQSQNAIQFRGLIKTAAAELQKYELKDIVMCLAEVELTEKELDSNWKVRQISENLTHSQYRYTRTLSEQSSTSGFGKVIIHNTDSEAKLNKAAKTGQAVANGMALTRELGNLPGNICTPSYLATEAKKLGKKYGLKVSVLSEKQMEDLKMGSFLSVSRGSQQPAKLIIFEYQGAAKADKPIALVGKGVTFDSGGISLKPGAAMDEMKFDMCGAASVFGVMRALGELKPKINVVGLIGATENLPSGTATKPGDVVTSMSGQTIEILNTDAEGRLVLCDVLTYSEKYKPKAVIDIATLTGACVIALGKQCSAVLGNDQNLIDKLLKAGQTSTDRTWQLPLWPEYQEQLKSNFADMANIGGREAGTITAACFLSRFAKKLKRAHLDIAGIAWDSGVNKGATGRPVPLLMEYILSESKG